MPYGVANSTGQVPVQEARRLLVAARRAGIDTVDTAAMYGDSEARLGTGGVRDLRVITKLPGLPADCADVDGWVRETLAGSLQRLGLDRVGGLLLHRPADLLDTKGSELAAAMLAAKSSGRVGAVGYSVYDPREIAPLRAILPPDLVQAPYNVLDRRIEGAMAALTEAGIEVHVRSAFLQGLLVMERGTWPLRFRPWTALLERWLDWCAASDVSPVRACLAHAAALPGVGRIVVGVETLPQLGQLLEAIRSEPRPAPAEFASEDEMLINPSNWPLLQ